MLGEFVAKAPHGLNVAGLFGVGFYFPADMLDMDVGGAGLAEEVAGGLPRTELQAPL